jgi:folylpolyglutamate synthase
MSTTTTTTTTDDDSSIPLDVDIHNHVQYTSAIAALYSTEHQSVTPEALAQTSLRRTRTVPDMQIYMERVGLLHDTGNNQNSPDDSVAVIHVAGTKGKGSVCAMCESIVRNINTGTTSRHHRITTGLFTSPHLVDIRERIRINGQPVSKDIFGRAYWNLRQLLEQYQHVTTGNDDDHDCHRHDLGLPVLPGYFRMITLMAIYIFRHYVSEDGTRISCIIMEVGMGGRYDATNVNLPWSRIFTVCGITLIDYDHVRVLGNTLPEIAWEKGGIYTVRKGATDHMTPHPVRDRDTFNNAVANLVAPNTSSQSTPRCFALDTNPTPVLDVFRLCAINEGDGCDLHLVGPDHHPQLPIGYPLGLNGSHQRANAELALALCRTIFDIPNRDRPFLTVAPKHEDMLKALANVTWPGRCQSVQYENEHISNIPVTIRLDGAHTVQSVRAGLEWYQSVISAQQDPSPPCDTHDVSCCRILIFNCSHERNPVELLELLHPLAFHAVYFCRADSERPSSLMKGSVLDLWQAAGKSMSVHSDTVRNLEIRHDDNAVVPTWQDTLLGIWNLLAYDNDTAGSSTWRAMDRGSNLTAATALDRGLEFGRTIDGITRIEMFCTGSLYLVGSMLSALQWQEQESNGMLKV